MDITFLKHGKMHCFFPKGRKRILGSSLAFVVGSLRSDAHLDKAYGGFKSISVTAELVGDGVC